ncbi:uncharacterized protein LOC107001710 isoform X1 [Solanum pennellii]|uniref:Uncharacterized protein LOC107001710 isoform X1 n=2 Tax=Solanum pennellii TaxID=28526 RepID=A0ABM1FD06_SOLPN|nr:uncharacterized protein LOC107001710 isoform X1 [Solanum pennellii]
MSDKKMEKEDGVRTVECLRGRLIAERAASKRAKEDAEFMGNKLQLIELETKLKEESKSRNKAEKKLKYFIKKLESMNICYISDESEHSSLFDKSEISSVTSTTTTSNSSKIISEQNSQFKDSMIIDFQDSQELISQENNSKELEFSNSDANSSKSIVQEEEKSEEDNVNSSLALVPIDLPKPKSIDPIVLDTTVREVLDALRHAKEKLQTQMERGRGTIKVG